LTGLLGLGIVFDGVIYLMSVTVRRAQDWACKPVSMGFLLAFLCLQAAFGQEQEETTQQTNDRIQQLSQAAKPVITDIPVGAGDVIHIDVFDVPELSRDVRVSSSGNIALPLVHERIHVAGVTPYQLEQTIQEKLIETGLVSHPQVSVFVKEQTSQPVTILGAVAHPMTMQLLRPTNLLEVLANAGGIADNAGTVILVTRKTQQEFVKPVAETSGGSNSDSGVQTIRIQLQDLLDTGNASFNIQIFGGDVIEVPKAGIIYVLGGGATQPGGYPIQSHGEPPTVLKAVALARGLSGFAKANDAVIYRVNPKTGEREAIPVHIKKIEKDTSEDVAMKSNDILYIPDSLAKKVAVRGLEAAVSIGSGLLIYRSTLSSSGNNNNNNPPPTQ
jgi:polysaccharide biosynthesis/export protein